MLPARSTNLRGFHCLLPTNQHSPIIIQIDYSSFAALLRRFGNAKSLSNGRLVHELIIKHRYERFIFLGNLLVQMYGSCGSMQEARSLFENMHQRDHFSWNFVIAAYARLGQAEEALLLFDQMLREGVMPDRFIVASILSACAMQAAESQGRKLHARISGSDFESDVGVATALINMYGKCGTVEDARRVFYEVVNGNVFAWTAMIAAYAENGDRINALQLFDKMHQEGILPNKVTLVGFFTTCANHACLAEGKREHACIARSDFSANVTVGNALVNMYGKCSNLKDAQRAFNEMVQQDVVSWNSLIAAYDQHGQAEGVFQLLNRMQHTGVLPNIVTLVTALHACASQEDLDKGLRLHAQIHYCRFESDFAVESALLNMYGKCSRLEDAWKLFRKMPEHDLFSWNAMISACMHHAQGVDAFQLFHQMQQEGTLPDKVTFTSVLSACVLLPHGKSMHSCIVSNEFESDIIVGTALVNMYGNCNNLEEAVRVFSVLKVRNTFTWTAVIAAHAQLGQGKDALELFDQMQQEGAMPNEVTFLSIISACSREANLSEGKQIHARIMGAFQSDILLENAFINMYGKCGKLEDAQRVFGEMTERDTCSWTAMIAAYGEHGKGMNALNLFNRMHQEGIVPDRVTILSVLSTCSHCGLVDEGCQIFIFVSRNLGLTLEIDHFDCMSDLLGRAGRLDDLEELIKNMPYKPTEVSWLTVLAACRYHSDVVRGECAAQHVLDLDPKNTSQRLMLRSMYVASRTGDVTEKTFGACVLH